MLVLLAGIAAVLLAFGKFDYLGWISCDHVIRSYVQPREASPGQRALVKFYVLVALVFLFQTLVGGATAHPRMSGDRCGGKHSFQPRHRSLEQISQRPRGACVFAL